MCRITSALQGSLDVVMHKCGCEWPAHTVLHVSIIVCVVCVCVCTVFAVFCSPHWACCVCPYLLMHVAACICVPAVFWLGADSSEAAEPLSRCHLILELERTAQSQTAEQFSSVYCTVQGDG